MITRPPDLKDATARKRAAARAAVAEVRDGMLVGLGTGSSANIVIAELGDRAAAGLKVTTVATSLASHHAAEAAGLVVLPFDTLARLDLAIDGADEIDPQLRAIKGKGGAMLREKIVATAAKRMIVVVDASKRVTCLGKAALPIEVLPFAAGFVSCRVERLGATVSRRMAGNESYRTEQGNIILDCRFDAIDDPQALSDTLSVIPGLLGHGLFLDEIDAVYVGASDEVIHLTRAAP